MIIRWDYNIILFWQINNMGIEQYFISVYPNAVKITDHSITK